MHHFAGDLWICFHCSIQSGSGGWHRRRVVGRRAHQLAPSVKEVWIGARILAGFSSCLLHQGFLKPANSSSTEVLKMALMAGNQAAMSIWKGTTLWMAKLPPESALARVLYCNAWKS